MSGRPSAWICPECAGLMDAPPRDYHICPGCRTEFGVESRERTDEECESLALYTLPEAAEKLADEAEKELPQYMKPEEAEVASWFLHWLRTLTQETTP